MSEQAVKVPITVAYGDGIGPEIMKATLRILEAAGARLDVEVIEVGEQMYASGYSTGIAPEAWASLRRTKVFLKAPITTPRGGGYKSLNVTIRKTLGLFANVRPVRSLSPFVQTLHPEMDVVVVRENEEDLYAGIEHRQTQEVTQCLKLITAPGSERIVRYAFEYARQAGRRKVTCLVKDNIMKITDGLFRKTFERVAQEYPEIEAEHLIVDIGMALVADQPERFDVLVTLNLYGDILSDITAQIAGSVGMGGSANIGEEVAMFEAIHGSAPDIAGQGIANPSGLLQGALLMLQHIGQGDVAERVQNAWLKTIEDGIHTGDIYSEAQSVERVNTQGFCDAVIARLGQLPERFPAAVSGDSRPLVISVPPAKHEAKALVGVDVFADWAEGDRDPDVLAARLQAASTSALELVMITNRGVKVWPSGLPETFKTDHWRCRFERTGDEALHGREVVALLGALVEAGVDVIKTEHLYTFDGERGYSLGQGQ